MKMLFLILIQAMLMLPLKETDAQEIAFDPMKPISPCTQGLRNGTDNFTFTGTAGKNVNELIRLRWFPYIDIQISVSPSKWTVLCLIFFDYDGRDCNALSQNRCFCHHMDSTTGSIHFIINQRAELRHSKGIIRGVWKNVNYQNYSSASTAPLPVFYDVYKAKLVLKVNGVAAELKKTHVGVNFLSNENNNVELCCINTASPCYPLMSFNGQAVESQANCVNHTVFVADVKYTATLKLSYAVCTKSEIIQAGSAVIKTVKGTRTTSQITTTEEPGASTLPFGSTPEEPENQTLPFGSTPEEPENQTLPFGSTPASKTSQKPTTAVAIPEVDSTPLILVLAIMIGIGLIAIGVGIVCAFKQMSTDQNLDTVAKGGTISAPEEEEAAVESKASFADQDSKIDSIVESEV